MRLWIMLLAGAASLAAQSAATPSQELEEQAQTKLREFERKLQNAMRLPAAKTDTILPRVPERACAIPLLQAKQDASFQSNMPVIVPDSKNTFAARELISAAPVCGEQTKK